MVGFDIINLRNKHAANFARMIASITEPMFKPIRKIIPPIGGWDLSPLVLVILISLLKDIVFRIFIA